MTSHVIQDSSASFTIFLDANHAWGQFRSTADGSKRRPMVPLLAIEVYDRLQQRTERLHHYVIDRVEVSEDTIHVTVSDHAKGLVLGLWLKVIDGELSVLLPPAEIYEHKSAMYKLFSVEPLPGLLKADAGGEMLLPISTGILSYPADKPALEDRFLIYGLQSRWELLPTMPICAVQTDVGGLVQIAVAGAAETECRVATDGQGNGTVGLSFYLRGHDPDQIEPSNRELRIIPVPAKENITVFAAKRLRKHVIEDLGKTSLKQRAEESPEVAHLIGAHLMKIFFGMQMQGIMLGESESQDATRFFVAMTFDEAQAGMKALHAAGVDRIYTQSVGWNFRGHDGAYPTRFPVEERVGGEKGFRELISLGHELGDAMTVHDNFMEAYASSPDFDLSVLCQDVYGQPQIRGFWGGGASYLIWPDAVPDESIRAHLLRVKDLGIRGPYYLDGMGTPLYTNYSPHHGGTRTAHMRGMDHVLQLAKEVYGSCATETGFLYCSITPDLIGNPGSESYLKACKPEWPITQMLDQRTPLWQIAMSGLILVESQGIDWADTMKALLYGHHPRFEWSTRPGIHPVLDDVVIQKIKARYDLLIKQFGHLCLHQIIDHTQQGKTQTTTFDDGTQVMANFDTGELRVNGELIECPKILQSAEAAHSELEPVAK